MADRQGGGGRAIRANVPTMLPSRCRPPANSIIAVHMRCLAMRVSIRAGFVSRVKTYF